MLPMIYSLPNKVNHAPPNNQPELSKRDYDQCKRLRPMYFHYVTKTRDPCARTSYGL